jgi:hypothetical protein
MLVTVCRYQQCHGFVFQFQKTIGGRAHQFTHRIIAGLACCDVGNT